MNRHRPFQPAPVALLSLAAIVVLLFAVAISLLRLGKAGTYADHTFDVSIALQETLTAMVDTETASRGYLLTRDGIYIESLERAERELHEKFADLRQLTRGSPVQLRRVDELERLSTARSRYTSETVDLVEAGHSDVAIDKMREGGGKRLMDQAREVASDMAAHENELLRSHVAAMQRGYRLSTAVLVVAGVVLLGLAAILLTIDRDIRQRKSLERSLKEAVHAREQMLAIVSHDLRNPLSIVTLGAKLIERCAGPEPSGEHLKKHANTIVREVERMDRLVADLLDMSKVEAGRSLPVELARRDGAELLSQSVQRLEPLARAKGLRLTMDAADGTYDLDCDAGRLQQVFSNLIGNAIKFTPERGSITARVSRSNGDVVFSVSDTGGGIPKADVSRLFDPYWQANTNRSGAGLGLSIVKAIVEAHRGRVWVETDEGTGSSFHCALPAAARNEAPWPGSSEPRAAEFVSPGQPAAFEGSNDRR